MAIGVSLLVGCATRPVSIPEPVEIPVPVRVPCIVETPVRPQIMPDADLLSLDDYRAVVALRRDRLLLERYAAEADAVMRPCVRENP
jgi:hypothetical protein